MKKIILFLLLAFILFLYTYDDGFFKNEQTHMPIENHIPLSQVKKNTSLQASQIKIVKRKVKKSTNPSNNYDIFEEEDIDDIALKLAKISDVEPISAIRMKQNTMKDIKVGDTLLLPEIDGNTYQLQIHSHTISKRGNVSLNGSFYDNGIKYSTILTEGKESAFISMNTPMGTYELELRNGIGFIYKSFDIEKEKIDYTKSDTLQHH